MALSADSHVRKQKLVDISGWKESEIDGFLQRKTSVNIITSSVPILINFEKTCYHLYIHSLVSTGWMWFDSSSLSDFILPVERTSNVAFFSS